MSLASKYNIPAEVVTKMVNDGVISCSWPRWEEIYKMYKEMQATGKSQSTICYEISEKEKISYKTVQNIIYKF